MNEHDDDLEPQVTEQAEQERDTYPETGDELDAVSNDDDTKPEDEELSLDDDEAEL